MYHGTIYFSVFDINTLVDVCIKLVKDIADMRPKVIPLIKDLIRPA